MLIGAGNPMVCPIHLQDISYQGVWAGFAAVAGYIILLLLLASRRVRSVD